MKKIISALIIIAMLCSALMAAIPAFADDLEDAKSDLGELIEEADRKKEIDFTEESWAAFSEALDAANTAMNDQYPTVETITTAKAALTDAMDALKEVTLEDLKAKIDAAALIENKGFSKDTWDNFVSVLEEAEEFYEDNEGELFVDEDELKENYANLKNVLGNMKYDTTALYAQINKAKTLLDNSDYAEKLGFGADYTKETYDALKAAYEAAKADAKTNDYDKITAATEALKAAINALDVIKVPDELKDELAELMDLADVLIPSEWAESAWKMVEMKVEQGKKVIDNIKVSTYVKAIRELEQALMNLTNEDKPDKDVLPDRPVVDTEKLDGLIKWCDDNLVESAYEADSWRKLADALTHARSVSENPRKAEKVQDAYERLNKARKELVAVEGAAAADGATDGGDDAVVGCKSAIGATVVVMTAVLGLGTTVVLRKKED